MKQAAYRRTLVKACAHLSREYAPNPRLRKGDVFAYVGRIHNLKDLKSHSLRAICTVLLDPRDLLLHSERMQGFAVDPDYGRAKCLPMLGSLKT